MTKHREGLLLEMISLDRAAPLPLYRQLDGQLREAVLSGRLAPGTRLPATRQLALELGVSRLTVQNSYEQLVAEGFLTAVTGAGTFVAEIPLEDLPPPRLERRLGRRPAGRRRRNSGPGPAHPPATSRPRSP